MDCSVEVICDWRVENTEMNARWERSGAMTVQVTFFAPSETSRAVDQVTAIAGAVFCLFQLDMEMLAAFS